MTDELIDALRALAAANLVHTVEVWAGDELVGGLFGVTIGAVFIMESGFHCRRDAGKVAVADLASRLAGAGFTLIDTELKNDYLVEMGAFAMPRAEYFTHLHAVDRLSSIQDELRSAQYLLKNHTTVA